MSDSLCELVSFVEDEKERGSFSIYVTLHSFESIFFEMGFSVDDLYLLFLLVVDIFARIPPLCTANACRNVDRSVGREYAFFFFFCSLCIYTHVELTVYVHS